MSGWKSRWSWLRLVNAATANRTPSTRCSSSACEETSIAHAASPASSIAANVACRSIASGVVRTAAAPPRRRPRSRSPSRPQRTPAASSSWRRRNVVVVFPLVPVMPTTWSVGRRVAVEARGRGGHRRCARRRRAPRARRGRAAAFDDERGGAALDRVGGEVVPVAGEARDAEEQRPGPHRPVVEGQGGDVHVGPVAEQIAQRHAALHPSRDGGRRALTDSSVW